MADLQQIGRALAGFGAGVMGQGQQFMQGLQQQRQQLDEQRRRAMLTDLFGLVQNLEAGNKDAAIGLMKNRIAGINQLGGDPSDSMDALAKLEAGDFESVYNDAVSALQAAQAFGEIQLPERAKPTHKIVDGQLITISGDAATAKPIEGFAEDTGAAEDRKLRERELTLKEQTEERQKTKLSATSEKALNESQDLVITAQRSANQYDVLANDFEKRGLEGGVAVTFEETMKQILGTQDDVTEFRRKFNNIRFSEGIKNLPPGPATDKDVQLALEGVPPKNAPAGQVASFLRGAAKLARLNAAYNQFKSDFINQTRSIGGLNRSWRKKFEAPKLDREVSMAEIYQTAQNRGINPEEVMSQLGITFDNSVFGVK